MPEKYIVANTCQDRCGIQRTGETHDGHTVYRCPGCDSRWYDTDEKAAKGRFAGLKGRLRHTSD